MRMRFVVQPLLLLIPVHSRRHPPGRGHYPIWDVAGKAEISLEQAAGKVPITGHCLRRRIPRQCGPSRRPVGCHPKPGQTQTPHSRGPGNVSTHRAEHPRRLGCQSAERGGDAPGLCPQLEQDWHLYRDIFLYCRERRIPMVGLNVPRSITRKVAQNGFESLTPEEIGKLPPIVCRVDREYEEFLRRVLGSHGSESGFRRFCEAQLVWDTAMAIYALEYLKNHPERTVVVLCGMIHAWKKAAPEQAARENADVEQAVIQPAVKGRWTPGSVSRRTPTT
jgi:hypothetical protein